MEHATFVHEADVYKVTPNSTKSLQVMLIYSTKTEDCKGIVVPSFMR